jgi:hypothetical protein
MKKTLLTILPLLLIIGCSQKPVEETILIEKDGVMYLPDSDKPYTGEVFTNYSTGEKEYQGTYENGLLVQYSYLNKDGNERVPVNGENLIDRGGLLYETNGQKPYTGDVFELFDNGKKYYNGSIRGGKKFGEWTYFTKFGDGQYNVDYNSNPNYVTFEDSLGYKFTGIPATKYSDELNKENKTGTFLIQENGEIYDFSTFPNSFGKYEVDKDGKWYYWNNNGQMESKGSYLKPTFNIDGESITSHKSFPYGKWTFFRENGQKYSEGSFTIKMWGKSIHKIREAKEGTWVLYDVYGRKESEGEYKANTYYYGEHRSGDIKVGKWINYNSGEINFEYFDENGISLGSPEVRDFVEKIISNSVIDLENKVYDFTPIKKLTIKNMENITINGNGSKILTDDGFTSVVSIINCKNIIINDVIMGHNTKTCLDPVVIIENSNDISFNRCILFGSGASGIQAKNSQNIILQESTIKECTYNILTSNNSGFILNGSTFSDNGGGFDRIINSSMIIDKCTFINNSTNYDEDNHLIDDSNTSNVLITNCVFRDNGFKTTGLCIDNYLNNIFEDINIENDCD